MKQFTNLYQLSKTLKFKLEPVGNTKTTFKKWIDKMNCASEDDNLFAKDKSIRDAYLAIKPIMDKLHEQFIEKSLTIKSAFKQEQQADLEALADSLVQAVKEKNVD